MQQTRRDPTERNRVRHGEHVIEHLLRRAGFGASDDDIEDYLELGLGGTVRQLLDYETVPDDVDALIGKPGYALITARGEFLPRTVINDSRQRWLFRMIHSRRPLQEKMTLFWHNHFATAYTKVVTLNGDEGARYMAAKPSEDPNQVKGQIELLRQFALGNFRDLLLAIAKDTAMLVWLDGRTNVKGRPQENFARELMELFTMGVDTFAEADVYAGARVFTGWNLARPSNAYYTFSYVSGQHDTTAKEFTFPIYSNGSKTIPAPRLARKLYQFFISEVSDPDPTLISELASIYYRSNFEMKPVLEHLLLSPQFVEPSNRYARYSWPAEFVARAIKEIGWSGFSVNDALGPMANMGQQLFEPPDVAGWDLGTNWFSSGAMLTRMNFASQLATNQKFNLRDIARGAKQSPDALVSLMLDRLTAAPFAREPYQALVDYARTGSAWTGSDAQLLIKAAGLAHLIVGSGDYQLV